MSFSNTLSGEICNYYRFPRKIYQQIQSYKSIYSVERYSEKCLSHSKLFSHQLHNLLLGASGTSAESEYIYSFSFHWSLKSEGEADTTLMQCPRDQGIPRKSLSGTIKHIIPAEIFSPKGCFTARSLAAAASYQLHGSVQSCTEHDNFAFFSAEQKTCRNPDSIWGTHEI